MQPGRAEVFSMAGKYEKGCGVYLWNLKGEMADSEDWDSCAQHNVCDNIWLTCCALHNMLLDDDGLNKRWKHGIRSRWEMGSGEFLHNEIPFAIHKLVDPTGTEEFRIRQYDGSRFGYQCPSPIVVSDNEEEEDDDISDDEEGINGGSNRNRNGTINPLPSCPIYSGRIESGTAVNQLNFFQFCSLLVENFNIRFYENNIQWPRRLAHSIPRNVPVLIPATNVY